MLNRTMKDLFSFFTAHDEALLERWRVEMQFGAGSEQVEQAQNTLKMATAELTYELKDHIESTVKQVVDSRLD
jgi:hypothetical protein